MERIHIFLNLIFFFRNCIIDKVNWQMTREFKTWVDLDGCPWTKSEIIRRVGNEGMFSKTVDIFEGGNNIYHKGLYQVLETRTLLFFLIYNWLVYFDPNTLDRVHIFPLLCYHHLFSVGATMRRHSNSVLFCSWKNQLQKLGTFANLQKLSVLPKKLTRSDQLSWKHK